MVKNPLAEAGPQFGSLGREDPLQKEVATPLFLPWKSHGQSSLFMSYSLRGCKESDTTKYAGTRILLTVVIL